MLRIIDADELHNAMLTSYVVFAKCESPKKELRITTKGEYEVFTDNEFDYRSTNFTEITEHYNAI